MCGIAGTFGRVLDEIIARRVAGTLSHRGPDAHGIWNDPSGATLIHTRLSILDLSSAGAQPMESEAGRFTLTYNGEIYNIHELRAELEMAGAKFKGHSDTEVLLAGIERLGLEETLPRIAGMFAFAVWDRQLKQMHLVRDRLGIKPLYYSYAEGKGSFGSELKAMMALPGFSKDLDFESLGYFFRYGYIPAPRCIFKHVEKVLPGEWVRFSAEGIIKKRYWNAHDYAAAPVSTLTFKETVDELEQRLIMHLKEHMVADVPVGAFLSGGIDSTTLVALAQSVSTRKIKTYSIGFTEKTYDESEFAGAVAERLGTEHTRFMCDPKEALEMVETIPDFYDEPFGDSSAIPTMMVSRMARKEVTVAMSGDGGDELFGGYNRYLLWRKMVRNGAVGRVAASVVRRLPTSVVARMVTGGSWVYPALRGMSEPGVRVKKAAQLVSRTAEEFFSKAITVSGSEYYPLRSNFPELHLNANKALSVERTMMMHDLTHYLPEDILTKVDRATMSVSLEGRVPYLDHRLVEWSWTLPMEHLIKDGEGKRILRSVLYKHVPKEMMQRPKRGFAIPVHDWFRGPLKTRFESVYHESAKECGDWLALTVVDRTWKRHLQGQDELGHQLWNYFMFFLWYQKYLR
ncbi:MAG: asparagine synthase (glutamine-hydrolyzing) [Verrucomicrobiota bacterium]|nr:asparagine synthase (glutamine-hydrolyzing) [Verrucomicrobiota bacterium]